ncbi:hypothetical protein Tco_1268296 [Tanacetum coccineum]
MPDLHIYSGNKIIVCPKTSSRSSSSSRRALFDLSKYKGGVPDDGASGLVWESMMGGGNGSKWEVDAASALSRIIAARYPNGPIGLAGGDGDNTGTGDDTGSGGKDI